jgi:hypothetical protein
MQALRGTEVTALLTSTLHGVSGQCHISAALYPQKRTPPPLTVPIGYEAWVGLRAGLDIQARGKILCLCWGSNPGRSLCSQTLFRLSYPSLTSHLTPRHGYMSSSFCVVLFCASTGLLLDQSPIQGSLLA